MRVVCRVSRGSRISQCLAISTVQLGGASKTCMSPGGQPAAVVCTCAGFFRWEDSYPSDALGKCRQKECDGVKRPAMSSATCLWTFLGGMMLISGVEDEDFQNWYVTPFGKDPSASTRALLDSPKESCPALAAAAFTALHFPYTA